MVFITGTVVNILASISICALILCILYFTICWILFKERLQRVLLFIKEHSTLVISVFGIVIALLQAQIVTQQNKIIENQSITDIISNIKFGEPLSLQFAISQLSKHGNNGYEAIL